MKKTDTNVYSQVSHTVAENLLATISRYDPTVFGAVTRYPERRTQIIQKLSYDVEALAYGLVADFGDGVWEKLEDFLSVAVGGASAGAGIPLVEILGFLAERIILAPAEKGYHSRMDKYHPNLSGLLKIYQFLTEAPGLDSIASMIPEKTLFATGALVYDIWRISEDAKRYMKEGDYVGAAYGDQRVLGVPGYKKKGTSHPTQPLLASTVA